MKLSEQITRRQLFVAFGTSQQTGGLSSVDLAATRDGASVTLTASDGSVAPISGADASQAGVMTAGDKAKLDALPPNTTREFGARAAVPGVSVGAAITHLRTAGYASPGDGGGALYKRAGVEPSHGFKVQSADGAWWEGIPESLGCVNIEATGADGVGDDVAALNAALAAGNTALIPSGTFTISDYTLGEGKTIKGENVRLSSKLAYGGTGTAVSTTNVGAFNFHYDHRLEDIFIQSITAGQGTGVNVRYAATPHLRKARVEDFNIGVTMLDVVHPVLEDCRITNISGTSGRALEFNSNAFGCNLVDLRGCTINGNDYVFYANNANVPHLVDFAGNYELNANLYGVTGSYGRFYGPVHIASWFESNTNYNLAGVDNALFFAPSLVGATTTITGGVHNVWEHVRLSGADNFPEFYTPTDVSIVSVAPSSWNAHAKQHGVKGTMPKIGSFSTPIDKQYTQGVAQSMLLGEMGGILFGHSQPTHNRIPVPVSNTGAWGLGGATVTTGQADPFGGTSATKLEKGGGSGLHGLVGLSTGGSEWAVAQITFKMVAEDETFGFWTEDIADGTQKRNYYKVGDTEWRVAHMLFYVGGDTSFTMYLALPASGIIVHRVGLFAGTQLRPMIAEGANIDKPFIAEFDRVKTFGSAAPTSGTWRVGDVVYDTAPTAGGTMGWICTTAGTPGTWKTFGSIAA